METQLLNIDCFGNTANKALDNLNFLRFPVAHIPSSSPTSTFLDILILCLDSAFEVSLGIDKLPIDNALSKFFSDVLPQNVDGDPVDFEVHFPYSRRKSFGSEEEAEALHGEKEVDCHKPSESEILEIEVPKKSNGSTADYRYTHHYEIIQFETPELDVLLENASFFGKDELHILSNIPEIENNSEMLKPGNVVQYSCGVQESILSVEDIALEVPMEQKSNMSKNDGSFEDQFHFNPTAFPLVEADEIVLGSILDFSVEDKLFSFFENIELQHWTQKDKSDISGTDLLGSREYDMTQLLYTESRQFHDSEIEFLEYFSEIDLISMVEISQVHVKSENAGTLVCDSFLLDTPIVFQEFQILEGDSSENFEVIFNKQTTDEPGTCGLMFSEDMNFMNFNKLIVSHELALVDNIFKSLPVPLLDHEKLRSLYVTIEEKLADLKPQPLSALDGIYLDWHLLEEDNLSCKTYFDDENLLGNIDSPRNDFDLDCLSDGKLLYNLIFSEDGVDGLNVEEKMELKQLFSDASVITNTIMVGDSSKLSDDFPQPEDREQLAKNDEDSLLFKSTSQFNDLDFFMNPQKATSRENSTSVAKACLNSNATSAKVPLSNSFPAVSKRAKSHSSLAMNENINKHNKPCNLSPVQDKSNMRSLETARKVEAQSMPLSIPSTFGEESEHIQQSMISFPERLVLVNTQNLDKEMIVSRRSTYQRILAMEKEGAQVVERDSDLPVDVIISSEICLMWYDCRNIGKKATALDEASSCLPLCIDNIATNVLTLLSFTFSGCIMIFEGEDSFLSTVMESSDGLYAAAASLGINIQLFCSHSSELTDEIILNCIVNATELTRGVYPRMSESETLAESFLTKFPSVNPLTAHAILSSGVMLIEFLEWSHEHRVSAIRKYHVPDESITLFSALCKYGEREDSRSIMTECSSSVSSGPDSGRFNFNAALERKRRKYNCSPDKCDIRIEDLLYIDSSNQFTTDTLDPSLVQKPYDSWISKDPEIFDELRKPRLPSQNYFFGEEQDLETTLVMKPSIIPKPYDLRMSKGPRILNDKVLGGKEESVMATMNDFDLLNVSNSEILHEDKKGEVIDLTGSPTLAEDFTVDNSVKLTSMPEMERGSTRKFKSARRLSFGQNSHPAFEADAEIYPGSDIWNFKKAQRESSQLGANICSYTDLENDVSPFKHRNKLLEESFKQKYEEKSQKMQFQEKETSPYGRTPLSNALRLNSPLQNTPWTMEFLNRIREKSRLRQQSLPPDNTAPCFGYSGNTSKDIRRSPSIIDFFKYQGGSSSRKLPEHKRQKRPIQSSSSSKNEKSSASILPTWTPADKRARQTLSFALDDGGNQSKLVWSDETHCLGKKLQRQI